MSTISPIHHLPSFWDDASDAKLHRQVQRSPPKRKSVLKLSEYSPPSSPEADRSFKEATLTYVGSPTGRRALDIEAPTPPPDSITQRDSGMSREVTIQVNGVSSIINESWPHPPAAIPSSPSATSSTYSTNGHGLSPSPIPQKSIGSSLYEDVDPALLRDVPFRGSDVPATPPGSPTPGRSILKQVKRRTSGGSIRRYMDTREGNYGLRPEDVIYMTVVKEITA
jgi:hypothetical protein